MFSRSHPQPVGSMPVASTTRRFHAPSHPRHAESQATGLQTKKAARRNTPCHCGKEKNFSGRPVTVSIPDFPETALCERPPATVIFGYNKDRFHSSKNTMERHACQRAAVLHCSDRAMQCGSNHPYEDIRCLRTPGFQRLRTAGKRLTTAT